MFLTTILHKKHSLLTHMNYYQIEARILNYYTVIPINSFFFQLAICIRLVLHMKLLNQMSSKLYECDSDHLKLSANSYPTSAHKLQAGLINIHKNYVQKVL